MFGRFTYVLNELSNDVSVFEDNGEVIKHSQNITTLPDDFVEIQVEVAGLGWPVRAFPFCLFHGCLVYFYRMGQADALQGRTHIDGFHHQ